MKKSVLIILISVLIILVLGMFGFLLYHFGYVPNQAEPDTEKTPRIVRTLIGDDAIRLTADDPVWGSNDAPNEMVIYIDYECPFCKDLYRNIKAVEKEFIETGLVKVSIRDLPLTNLHKRAKYIATVAECARKKGKFWEFADMVLLNDEQVTPELLDSWAKKAGVDLKTCLADEAAIKAVERDLADARAKQLHGTPAVFINNNYYKGTISIPGLKQLFPNTIIPEEQKAALLQDPVVLNENDPVWGSPQAPYTMVVYLDYECPYSKDLYQNIKRLEEDYIRTGKVRIIIRDLPLPSHENARILAVAAECARQKGKFWEFADLALSSDRDFSAELLENWTRVTGIDLNSCMEDEEAIQNVRGELLEAKERKLTETPAIFINDSFFQGTLSVQELEKIFRDEEIDETDGGSCG